MRRFSVSRLGAIVAWIGTALASLPCANVGLARGEETASTRVRVDRGHAWRPPFGLDRIGRTPEAVVEIANSEQPLPEYTLVASLDGREIQRTQLILRGKSPYTARVALEAWPTELVLLAKSSRQRDPSIVAKEKVEPPMFEAEAVAQPDSILHPVDLGMILVPSDWLLLKSDQSGTLQVAAIDRGKDVPGARVATWFESAPESKVSGDMPLAKHRRAQVSLKLPPVPPKGDLDTLHVTLSTPEGKELWRKKISTSIVRRLPQWPEFGAVRAKLRYDAPISIRNENGSFSSMRYADGWPSKLDDVVVSLPNGARFVFWRGSCYIPFWVGKNNTGLCYEWAETSPPKDGFNDCVEPLMDKECRYGRVTIMESTPARVHVRWSYQSCDFKYKVWGDSAVEDYYFYPDGLGTRVLTLQAAPDNDYELSEFIVLTPQATYPFSVLPKNLVDILFLDGQKRELSFPFLASEQGDKMRSRDMPAVYRVRLHKDERLTGIYFNPLDKNLPPAVFAPFSDGDSLVTPTYWGSHWPLARGNTTGSKIDDRIRSTPTHNSVMSWARSRPTPLGTTSLETLDTLGRSRPMTIQKWAWLIGMTDATDQRLLDWAKSYAKPPALELEGARLEADSYAPERRAIRLVVEADRVTINVRPSVPCVNPVLELVGAPSGDITVHLGDRLLDAKEYAWDGKTLWLNATLVQGTQVRLDFAQPVLEWLDEE